MSVRRVMPWPVQWLLAAVVMGFCAATGLWAFDFGKSLAGYDATTREEVTSLRTELAQVRAERDAARAVSNTSESIVKAEQAAQEQMLSQLRQLQAENQALRIDLGFFETLLPASGEQGVSIRAFQAERVNQTQVRWQLLVMQSQRNAPEFNGQLELAVTGVDAAGKPWTQPLAASSAALQFRQYRRVEAQTELPADVVVKSLTARVVQGGTVRASQSVDL